MDDFRIKNLIVKEKILWYFHIARKGGGGGVSMWMQLVVAELLLSIVPSELKWTVIQTNYNTHKIIDLYNQYAGNSVLCDISLLRLLYLEEKYREKLSKRVSRCRHLFYWATP